MKWLWLLLIPSAVFASENYPDNKKISPFIKFAGSLNTPSIVTNKLLSVGYQAPLYKFFEYQMEGGYFVDNLVDRKTVFGGPSLGITVVNGGLFAKTFVGPELVSNTDSHLSTIYEFNIDAEVGIKDKKGTTIGIGYKHMSNAQICNNCENLGRDFLFLKVGF